MSTSTTTARPLDPTDRPRPAPSVPAGVEYHRVLAGEKRRIGRGILAIVLLAVGFLAVALVLSTLTAAIDAQFAGAATTERTPYTPLEHAGSMLSLALMIPWSMLIQRWLYRVPGASLHSLTSRFRFDLVGKSLLIFGPAWLVVNALGFLAPSEEVPWSQLDLLAFFLVTVLLVPLQAAGEEYGVRGLAFRVIGGWTRSSRVGLVAGVVVTAGLFTLYHGATDVYSNVWYFVLWCSMAIITWRTGGLEIAVVLHAVLNTNALLMATYLRIDFGAALMSRSSGEGSPYQLVPTLAVVVITAVVWWWTRKTGPALTPRPAPGNQSATSPAHSHPVSAT